MKAGINPVTLLEGNLLPVQHLKRNLIHTPGGGDTIECKEKTISERHSNIERLRKTARNSQISGFGGASPRGGKEEEGAD